MRACAGLCPLQVVSSMNPALPIGLHVPQRDHLFGLLEELLPLPKDRIGRSIWLPRLPGGRALLEGRSKVTWAHLMCWAPLIHFQRFHLPRTSFGGGGDFELQLEF